MARSPNWKIKNLGQRKAEVLLFDEIGGWFGTTAKDFAQEITDLDVDTLTVRINSPGGDVFDGISIMNALKQHSAHVTARVEGMAASAASVIATGGADELVMGEASQLMIHDAWSIGFGNAADMAKLAADLDRTSDTLAAIYARKAGTPQEEWRDAMREETWYTADEAVAAGLADRTDESDDADADDSIAAFARGRVMALFKHRGRDAAPAPKVAAHTTRKDKPVTINRTLAQKLGMTSENPTDSEILAALDETLAEQAADTEPTPTAADKVKEAGEVTEPKEEEPPAAEEGSTTSADVGEGYDPTETVTVNKAVWEDTLRRASRGDAATEEDKQERAENLIDTEGIKAGRLLGWQRDQWIASAVEDYDQTKKSLLALAPGTIPLTDTGRAGSDENTDPTEGLKARADASNILVADDFF